MSQVRTLSNAPNIKHDPSHLAEANTRVFIFKRCIVDQIDRAQKDNDFFLNLQIIRRLPELKPNGSCHWCEEKAKDNALFCDTDCRDDYEKRKRR